MLLEIGWQTKIVLWSRRWERISWAPEEGTLCQVLPDGCLFLLSSSGNFADKIAEQRQDVTVMEDHAAGQEKHIPSGEHLQEEMV